MPAVALQEVREGTKHVGIGVQLDLAGAVENDVVIIAEALQLVAQPILQILLQIVHAGHQTPAQCTVQHFEQHLL